MSRLRSPAWREGGDAAASRVSTPEGSPPPSHDVVGREREHLPCRERGGGGWETAVEALAPLRATVTVALPPESAFNLRRHRHRRVIGGIFFIAFDKLQRQCHHHQQKQHQQQKEQSQHRHRPRGLSEVQGKEREERAERGGGGERGRGCTFLETGIPIPHSAPSVSVRSGLNATMQDSGVEAASNVLSSPVGANGGASGQPDSVCKSRINGETASALDLTAAELLHLQQQQ
ncbi:unnamed protein product, partial [Lampetra fluviatilis]